MIKDVLKSGDKLLDKFTDTEIKELLKELEIEDLYTIDIFKNKDQLIKLVEVLTVTIVSLSGQNALLTKKIMSLEKLK